MPPILQPASPNTTTRPRTKTFPENDPPAEKQKHSLNARREGKMATVFFLKMSLCSEYLSHTMCGLIFNAWHHGN